MDDRIPVEETNEPDQVALKIDTDILQNALAENDTPYYDVSRWVCFLSNFILENMFLKYKCFTFCITVKLFLQHNTAGFHVPLLHSAWSMEALAAAPDCQVKKV